MQETRRTIQEKLAIDAKHKDDLQARLQEAELRKKEHEKKKAKETQVRKQTSARYRRTGRWTKLKKKFEQHFDGDLKLRIPGTWLIFETFTNVVQKCHFHNAGFIFFLARLYAN